MWPKINDTIRVSPMTVHVLHRIQDLPISIQDAWSFFVNPYNLAGITPSDLGFKVLSDPPPEAYPGLIIRYTVRPLGPFAVSWVSEISQVSAPHFFVDEQRAGPYRFWHHQHVLSEVPGGVRVEDTVHYQLPFGLLGDLVHALIVRRRLNEIFDYRACVLRDRFGVIEGEAVR